MTWTFIKEKDWQLRIDSEEQLVEYYTKNKMFENDRKHFHKLLKDNGESSYNVVAHSVFGGMVKNISKEYDLSFDEAYELIKNIQFSSMLNILRKTGVIYINRVGGFHTERENQDTTRFVHREKLEWPRYYSDDIRIKKFDDGTHYYAYIGDAQVRDTGGILKWDTEEEARKAAKKYQYSKGQNKI